MRRKRQVLQQTALVPNPTTRPNGQEAGEDEEDPDFSLMFPDDAPPPVIEPAKAPSLDTGGTNVTLPRMVRLLCSPGCII